MSPNAPEFPRDGIAVIGLAGRFPGARDAGAFWRNLCDGVESITALDERELEDAFDAETRRANDFVRARGILDEAEYFDAGFFRMQAAEAERTDPQHRVFLETCWEALEDAGYDPAAYAGAIGVYGGCSISTYFLRQVLSGREAVEAFASGYQVDGFPELIGSGADFLATRVAYKLNLRGPAMTVQSACSTSLLAIAQACQTLWLGQADMMLAGAVSISFPQRRGYIYQDGGMVSRDGHCRTFDADSSGTVFGAGAGVVVLKPLARALRDGDNVYAVIRGTGVNNDGSAKVGYSAPSVEAQANAIRAAHLMAGFAPDTIDYVECHGTATPLGDPIEIAALARAFEAVEPGAARCVLGSVKPNVGHLDVAAGMAGFIKTVLALRHGTMPPTLHFTTANPHIDFASTPFRVNSTPAPWPQSERVRRAGVSAFGVGGTNVHLALEGWEPRSHRDDAGVHLVLLSGRSERAVEQSGERLAAFLRAEPGVALGDVAWTLQAGRRAFPERRAMAVSSTGEALEKLAAPLRRTVRVHAEPQIAFMFPGQGAHYAGMGRALYARYRSFREAFDRCADRVGACGAADPRSVLFAEGALGALKRTDFAQPAIFTLEYALTAFYRALGIEPVASIGHSVGEFSAAVLAGVFELDDAVRVVVERGRLMQAMPPGSMLAVRLGEAELRALLEASSLPALGVAAVNGPRQCVVAGSFADIAALEVLLAERNVACKRLDTSHAFHSPALEPVRAPLEALIATMRLSDPLVPFVSTVTGRWIEAGEATSARYWADHALLPVRFGDALTTLTDSGVTVLVEAGPGIALSAVARQVLPRDAGCVVVPSLQDDAAVEERSVLEALGELWTHGASPKWPVLHEGREPQRVSLPTYPFERTRYWLEAAAPAPSASSASLTSDLLETVHVNGKAGHLTTDEGGTARALSRDLAGLLEELSGERVPEEQWNASFLELGFDSLFLGRFVQQLNAKYGVRLTFRQLLSDVSSLAALSARVLADAPAASHPAAPPVAARPAAVPAAVVPPADATTVAAVVREQLAAMQTLMREQLAALGAPTAPAPAAPAAALAPAAAPAPTHAALASEKTEGAARFDAFRVKARTGDQELTPAQRAHVDALIERVTAKTPKSKAYAQRYRSVLADPRVAAGFRPEWKEMVYPIVCDRASGARLLDIDGNEYVDVLNGFGQTGFGHAPGFVVEAVAERLELGFAIGPQTDLAGEVAELFCRLTGNERMTFCNTGSEAVMAALRVARTVTGRDRVVVFDGAYHGQFDEVLVKSARSGLRSIAVAPGIPAEAVANVTVLSYGTQESLDWISAHAGELAAVVVEPVQSRRPALVPGEFLRELRALTQAAGTALVFDEVVTGFRMHPGGMQAVFGIRADLATYGKVVGGGLPIGILAGSARFMDALDGGMWQYGDESVPEVAPTFFAGTFVRHPLAMAAVLAVLRHIEAEGPALQERLTARTTGMVGRLNGELQRRGIAGRIESYGSLFYWNFSAEERLAGLLHYHLRLRGIYVQEGFPCFLTTAHGDAEVERIVAAFAASLDELQAAGIFSPALAAGRPGAPEPFEIPLTEEQTEIWLAAQIGDEASCAFNESITLRLRGRLDAAAFAQALDRVVARHEALRGTYGLTGESMRIAPVSTVALEISDISANGSLAAEAALAEHTAADARTPFDLVDGPVVRARLFRLAEDDHALLFTAHHIACDGWSMNVLLGELAESYAAACRGLEPALPEPLAFSDYARRAACRNPLETAKVQDFWREQFAQPPPPLDLPTDRPRPALRSFRGATRSLHVDAARYGALKQAGARHGCTLFVTLLAAFTALAGRLGRRDDVVVGIPAAGQALLDGEVLVGHCVDFLPVRSSWSHDVRLRDLLGIVRRRVLDAYEHQEYTLGTLVRELGWARRTDRVPLAEIQFNLERVADGLHLPGLDVAVSPNAKSFVNFDLFLNAIESSDGLRLDCDYNTTLFDAETIDNWLGAYVAILDALVDDPEVRLAALPLPDAAPNPDSVLAGSVHPLRADASVHGLFEARAAVRPGAVAARCGDETVTYAELDARANRLAQYLHARTGSAGLVGILMDRSLEMLVALLATLKAGCAYVPLDPKHPAARLRHISEDAGLSCLLVDDEAHAAFAANVPVINTAREAAAIAAQPASVPVLERSRSALAYVIYTSGSTGLPKGVEIEHGSVVNLLASMAERPGLSEADVLAAVTTISFDIAALELFLPLSVGACVVIAQTEEAADGLRLAALLERTRATALQATPATWRMLLEAGFRAPDGFTMLCGGEALRPDLAARLLEGNGVLWNMYGPTETTIWSTCARIDDPDAITAGTPVRNTQAYVLAGDGSIVPRGETGELYLAGDGVARGYVAQPSKTAQKFIVDPFGPGRLYRTGDRARITRAGAVEILGRLDDQVKLRGFRIELGEIEAVLAQTGALAASAVALREDAGGRPRLVGYYVPSPGAAVTPAELQTAVAARLPEYMIPSAWVRLDALPLTPNGKLDRAALPAPAPVTTAASTPAEALTETERALARICEEVLRLERVGSSDDLFALGADSIQLFQITARANRYGMRVAAKQLFAHRTIAALARELDLARTAIHA